MQTLKVKLITERVPLVIFLLLVLRLSLMSQTQKIVVLSTIKTQHIIVIEVSKKLIWF